MSLESIIYEVREERAHQDRRWGGRVHDDLHNSHDWIAFIVSYAGKAVMWPWSAKEFRHRMVQVAALAVAAVQWVDRMEAHRKKLARHGG